MSVLSQFTLDWGTVPDWFAGVGTVAAVAVALWVSFHQSQIQRRFREDEEIASARLIYLSEPVLDRSSLDPDLSSIYVRIHNLSRMPVHELITVVNTVDVEEKRSAIELDAILPGQMQEVELDVAAGHGRVRSDPPTLYFLDSYGRRWRRYSGFSEPERIWNYIRPGLPTEVRESILEARYQRDRRWWKPWVKKRRASPDPDFEEPWYMYTFNRRPTPAAEPDSRISQWLHILRHPRDHRPPDRRPR